MVKKSLTSLVVVFQALAAVPAQGPPPTFEVASVKRNPSPEDGSSLFFLPGGRFKAINFPLRSLIAVAFEKSRPLMAAEIAGGPEWMSSNRFDILAKTDSDGPQDAKTLRQEMPALLRALLEDRFKLQTHIETRQTPIYALVLARRDGMLGPRMQRSVVDCLARRETALSGGSLPPMPPGSKCGIRTSPGTLVAGGLTLPNLIAALSGAVDRVLVDQTGLSGPFDVELEWTPDGGIAGPLTAPAPTDRPSLFAALSEQLGLKLESQTRPVDILVVDHVEHPTED